MSRLEAKVFQDRLTELYTATECIPLSEHAKLISWMGVTNGVMAPVERKRFENRFVALHTDPPPSIEIKRRLNKLFPTGVKDTAQADEITPFKLRGALAKKFQIPMDAQTNMLLANTLSRPDTGIDGRYLITFLFSSDINTATPEKLWDKIYAPTYIMEKGLISALNEVEQIKKKDITEVVRELLKDKDDKITIGTLMALLQNQSKRILATWDKIETDYLHFYRAAGVEKLPVWEEPQFEVERAQAELEQQYKKSESSDRSLYARAEATGAFNTSGVIKKPDCNVLIETLKKRLTTANKAQSIVDFDKKLAELTSLQENVKGKKFVDLERAVLDKMDVEFTYVKQAEMNSFGLTSREHDFILKSMISLNENKIRLPGENWHYVFSQAGYLVKSKQGFVRSVQLTSLMKTMNILALKGQDLSTVFKIAKDEKILEKAAIIAENDLHMQYIYRHQPDMKDKSSKRVFDNNRSDYSKRLMSAEAHLLEIAREKAK